jgi:transcriptional regulator with PAS, ATPase and Fis domain
MHTSVRGISEEARFLLQRYSWPGNVRELENLLERAVTIANMNNEDYLGVKHFASIQEDMIFNPARENNTDLTSALENLEKQLISQALEKTSYNKVQTAKMLGIHSSALYRKLSKYGLASS